MDFHEVHGTDVSSFDLPSIHRLPTVSAADALDELDGSADRFISTGLEDLDKALRVETALADDVAQGGVERGQVTEIWGPPGSGKTAVGIQLTANTLCKGSKSVWIDCFHPLCVDRLSDVLNSVRARHQNTTSDTTSKVEDLVRYTCPSLAHAIALLCRPTASSIPEDTSLLVIDSLSALINHAFPRLQDPKPPRGPLSDKGPPSTALRRIQVLKHIVDALQKLAATRDIAIVVLTQCATKVQDKVAILTPAITANGWDTGISTRLVVYRDWVLGGDASRDPRLICLQKKNGKAIDNHPNGHTAAFTITQGGLESVICKGEDSSTMLALTSTRTRTTLYRQREVADSDDDEFGWGDDDNDSVPPMPSQWQGSEDLLLGQQDDAENGEEEDVDLVESKSLLGDDETALGEGLTRHEEAAEPAHDVDASDS